MDKDALKKAIEAIRARPGMIIQPPSYCMQCGAMVSSGTLCGKCQYVGYSQQINAYQQGLIGGSMAQTNASQCPTCGGWYTGIHMCPIQAQPGLQYYVYPYGTTTPATYGPPVTGMPITSPTKTGIDKAKLDALQKSEPRKVLAKIPDYTEPITAYRCWNVTGTELVSLGVASGFWKPKQKIPAKCVSTVHSSYPSYSCECGYWAFKELDILTKAVGGYPNVKVIGLVSLWGRIIETENGYRSEYAYPKELWSLNADDVIEELGRAYGVPIRTANVVAQEERGATK